MSKKKIAVISLAAVVLIVSLTSAIPAFAAAVSPVAVLTQNAPAPAKMKALYRLLLVQDEAKVDALIAKGVSSGKLTAEQGTRIKDFWVQHHAQFTKNVVLRRLLTAKDETRVQSFLDKAVQSGKIQKSQADKIIQMWETLHSTTTAGNAA